jgi:hypothetical protein
VVGRVWVREGNAACVFLCARASMCHSNTSSGWWRWEKFIVCEVSPIRSPSSSLVLCLSPHWHLFKSYPRRSRFIRSNKEEVEGDVTLNLWWENNPVKLKSNSHHVPLRKMIYTQNHIMWYRDEARENKPRVFWLESIERVCRQIKRLPGYTLWTKTAPWRTIRICRWRTWTSLYKSAE